MSGAEPSIAAVAPKFASKFPTERRKRKYEYFR